MKTSEAIRFSTAKNDFFNTLNKRVNEYFKNNSLSRYSNTHMIVKTVFMFALYFVPFAVILTGTITNLYVLFGLSILMGLGVAGIGLAVMHDANHGAYSNKPWINNLVGYSLNIVGGNSFNWKVQHNVLHHTYTNIHDVDEDISPRGILRMCPHGEWKSVHRFQHMYAWFFYCEMTLVWVLAKDFLRIRTYHKDGLVKNQKTTLAKELTILIASKLLYFVYILGLPMWLTDITFGQWVIGFLAMHWLAGFILAVIFQPAHVSEGTEFPLPEADGRMDNTWAIHQLHTTSNYANKNRVLSWYCGGLNFQIEHHLFPNICHIHYRDLSKIVENTAKEFGLPYMQTPTFIEALESHARTLRALGKKPLTVPAHA
jgi:linoleoyl-CoA desaturase